MTQTAVPGPVVSIASYRPKPGCAEALRALLDDHVDLLREEGLATARPRLLLAASDGALLEVFEWVSGAAIEAAHGNPRVMERWEAITALCTHVPLAELDEAKAPFAGFRPLG